MQVTVVLQIQKKIIGQKQFDGLVETQSNNMPTLPDWWLGDTFPLLVIQACGKTPESRCLCVVKN